MNEHLITSSAAASDLLRHGLESSRGGDSARALQCFRAASEAAPAAGEPHFLIGAELAQAGDVEAAAEAFSAAVLLAPDFDMARFQLGLLQFISDRVAAAMLTWQRLFDLPDQAARHHIVRGFAALAADDFEQAAELLEAGMALNRSNDPLNADLRMVLQRIAQRRQEAGQTPAAPAVASAPEEEAAAASDKGFHVLLSNYRQDGPPN
jgi:tetratricopeptide (TPR) repeat protein